MAVSGRVRRDVDLPLIATGCNQGAPMEGSILCCPRWLRCGGASMRSTGITDTTGNRWFAVRDQYVASLAPLLRPLEAARDFAVQLTSSNQGRRGGGGLGLSRCAE